MTLSVAFEEVLRKYGIVYAHSDGGLRDDLLACYPTPSREALEKILKHQLCSGCEDRVDVVVDEVMAWASGTIRKEWCSHMKWIDMSRDKYHRSTGWYAKDDSAAYYSTDGFAYCPICATPRPPAA